MHACSSTRRAHEVRRCSRGFMLHVETLHSYSDGAQENDGTKLEGNTSSRVVETYSGY